MEHKEAAAAASGRHGRRGGAGPRLDPVRDVAIVQAALAGLAEHGYDRLSMDDVAARAGVGKAAIYRRWRSKAAMVAAALTWWREQLGPLTIPDTGTLRGDVDALVAAVPETGDVAGAAAIILDVATAATRDPAIAEVLELHVLARLREVLTAVLGQATARGEIPAGRNLALAPDIILGLNMLRLATGKPVDRTFVRQVFEQVILPLASAASG